MTTTFSKPLILYIAFVVLVFSGYLYLQLNGIEVYSSTKTEHEGQDGTYGSSHSSHHSTHHYYHK